MKILNIEDNVIRHNDICKALSDAGFREMDCILFSKRKLGR